ncbi:MAG: sulfatase [Bryobacterales bacterium]|nr:sulfatase [Bryobacterales bacterium]
MKASILVLLAAYCAAQAPLRAQAVSSKTAPNIVLIISDDHGWTDYGFMRHGHVRTPHIDKLAGEGLLYTRGYVPSSLCRPSLASIMTGLYPHQHGITANDPQGDARDPSNRERMVKIFEKSKTLAGMLATKGYVSLQTGKWWEGQCTCGGFTECMTHGDVKRGGRHGDDGLKIGRQTMQPILDFIDRAGNKPFFLWYAPMMPHTPHNPPDRLLARYRDAGLPLAVAKYYAMIEWFDETVGALLGHIETRGLTRNTLVVYLADNGWAQPEDVRPLHATRAKMSPYDAGLRTPIIVRMPGRVPVAREDAVPVSSIDIAPTVLATAGLRKPAEMPGLDLTKRQALAKRGKVFGAIFSHTGVDVNSPVSNLKYRWVIEGRWKLILPFDRNRDLRLWEGQPETAWSDTPELFDLQSDPKEQTNVFSKQQEIADRLKHSLNRWWNQDLH